MVLSESPKWTFNLNQYGRMIPPQQKEIKMTAKYWADDKIVRYVPPVTAIAYPFILSAFHWAISSKYSSGALIGLEAGIALLFAFLMPLLSLACAIRLSSSEITSRKYLLARRISYLAVASPPIYTLTGVILFMLGNPIPDIPVVSAFWGATIALIFFSKHDSIDLPNIKTPQSTIRVVHGVLAGILILLFIALHLGNHLFGLISPEVHTTVMKLLRHFYRAPVVEPLILIAFVLLLLTGVMMILRLSQRPTDGFKSFQIGSGMFLMFFLVSHVNAVLVLARTYLGIESDWGFASGAPSGLIVDPWNIRLVPLYAFAAFFAITHPFAGLRWILLNHGSSRKVSGWVFWAGIVLGLVVSAGITLALCGVRLSIAYQ
jgi:hypothetical protein